jgi:glycosyltransferase involved in cell wall biosynthesis
LPSLNILHVISVVAPRYGGAGVASQLMARYQARMGHKVTICTTNVDYPSGLLPVAANQPIDKDGVLYIHFKVSSRTLLFSLAMLKWMKKNISSFDIVHIHGLYRFPVTYAAWLTRNLRIPYLICPHGSLDPFLYKQSRYNIFLKRTHERLVDIPNLNYSSAIHYTSREEAERASFLGLRSRQIIVPNCIDWDNYESLPVKGVFRRRLGLGDLTPLVLFLGRINFKKGLDILVPAFSILAKLIPDARLAIVGPDNDGYGVKVKRWCRERDIEAKVLFVDYLCPKEVKQAYVDADVFVLPSYTENFGLTVVEAMACGCPVVISDKVNIWREIRMADAGIVTSLKPYAIAEAILNLLTNPCAAQKMGVHGRRAAEAYYGWPLIVGKLSGVYQELIDVKSPAVGYA